MQNTIDVDNITDAAEGIGTPEEERPKKIEHFFQGADDPTVAAVAERMVAEDFSDNLLIVGPSGSGKTSLMRVYGARRCCDVAHDASHGCGVCRLCHTIFTSGRMPGVGYNELRATDREWYTRFIRKIRSDIDTVRHETYVLLSEDEVLRHQGTLEETARPEVPECPDLQLQYATIASRASSLLATKVRPSQPIQELLNDAVLQQWVRQGRELHEGTRNTCGFCGNQLPQDLWNKLHKHFSEESEELRVQIASLVSDIDAEYSRMPLQRGRPQAVDRQL